MQPSQMIILYIVFYYCEWRPYRCRSSVRLFFLRLQPLQGGSFQVLHNSDTTSFSRMHVSRIIQSRTVDLLNRHFPNHVPMDFWSWTRIHPSGVYSSGQIILDRQIREIDIVGIMTIGISAFGK